MLSYIPFELQQLDQWVIAGPDKLPHNPRTLKLADVTDRSTWGSFAEAQSAGWPHVGFVLSKEDPYCIIDLDAPLTDEQRTRHGSILEAFQSYSELSQSGKGVHIICRGAIPKGVRRDKVEIYSDARYMICTGNIFKALPIIDCQPLLDGMFAQMDESAGSAELTQVEGHLSDEEVFTMARHAINGAKFETLWTGDFSAYPSQSEADFALLSMLCFYTKDNEQVRRIFRYSGLGKRDKAVRNDKYLDFALRKCRAKEMPLIDFSKLLNKPNHEKPTTGQGTAPLYQDTGRQESTGQEGAPQIAQPNDTAHQDDATIQRDDSATPDALTFPPGLVGDIARYILASAIRPVPEIALAASLALTAGVAGRAYNISGTGLNQYLLLLARTGSGKEGAVKGIDMLINAVRQRVPMADDFIGPSAFASGQALIRVLDKQPCFVSVLGEFGFTLQSLCDPKANAATLMLKKVLLDVYAKSGFTSILRSSVYSEAEKNTKVVQAPNISILGESTPEIFYDGLDNSSVAQGLIPRFSIFEYTGPRPPRNPNAFFQPPKELVEKFEVLAVTSLTAQQNKVHCPVTMDAEAAAHMDGFDEMATAAINSGGGDILNQLWNRAHLKALKLAALIAVGINPHQPVVDLACAQWACRVIERDISKLLARFSAGDVGQGDTRMESDLRRAVDDWLSFGKRKRSEYKCPESILDAPVVPVTYLRRRLRLLQSFRMDRRGSNAALTAIIKSMCEAGEMQQVAPLQAVQQFSLTSPLYVKGPNW